MLRGNSELLRKRITNDTPKYHFGCANTGYVDVAGSKGLIGVVNQSVDAIRHKGSQRILFIFELTGCILLGTQRLFILRRPRSQSVQAKALVRAHQPCLQLA